MKAIMMFGGALLRRPSSSEGRRASNRLAGGFIVVVSSLAASLSPSCGIADEERSGGARDDPELLLLRIRCLWMIRGWSEKISSGRQMCSSSMPYSRSCSRIMSPKVVHACPGS